MRRDPARRIKSPAKADFVTLARRMTIDTRDANRVGVLSETVDWKLNVAISPIDNFNEARCSFCFNQSERRPARSGMTRWGHLQSMNDDFRKQLRRP